jgi:hypothetical protein
VRFSGGASDLIDRDRSDDDLLEDVVVTPDPDHDPDDPEGSPFDVDNEGWTLDGVCRADRDGEERYSIDDTSTEWVSIDGAESLDPPPELPPDRPRRRTRDADLAEW